MAVTTCHSTAWGPPGDPYRDDFGGTSAAAAIVAGASIALQGLARVTPRVTAGGYVPAHLLTQRQVRLALKDTRWSTPAMDAANPTVPDPGIGRMPDLGALWPALVDGTLDSL
jgi:hypothetical protein